jgi:hypothetical protein|tara:strand:+ start:9212 stop:9643 length:432 start_codon:yes stop_codon:yes gene_type:complete
MVTLTESLDDFTWDNYKGITDALTLFDENRVEEEMSKQASIYSYYYGLMSLAKKMVNDRSTQLDEYSSLFRKTAKGNSSVKLTAKDLDDLVFSDERYNTKQLYLNEATFKYEMLKGLVRSLEHKRDMLVQLSSNKRAETKLYN